MSYDYLIVGAGFSGSVCARQLADAGKRVLIIDKRDHIGGNAYDYVNEHGVTIHKYGPHIFHTNSDAVFNWLSRFTEWRPYEHRVLASVQGKLVPFPINLTTLEMLGLEHLRPPAETGTHPANAEEQCLQRVGPELYELFFKGYTTKMWGRHPRELDASVTARIPVRWDSRDDRYFTDKHQAMPKDGYTALFERMLDHPRIEVGLGLRGHVQMLVQRTPGVIWTGPIDQYFGSHLGPLPYRSLHLKPMLSDKRYRHESAVTINYPETTDDETLTSHKHTRTTDMGRLTDTDWGEYTVTVSERPTNVGEPYYPVPCPEARALFKRYEALADAEPNVTFLGRLGSYQYLNMDHAVAQALTVSARLLNATPPETTTHR